jgi:hypothetical protein
MQLKVEQFIRKNKPGYLRLKITKLEEIIKGNFIERGLLSRLKDTAVPGKQ